mgnify:CR=1 FL=1
MKGLNSRHQYILEKIEKDGFISVSDLCRDLDVSAVTIRKDLQMLENKKLLFRNHGGASARSIYTFEKNVNEKETIQTEQKQKIAKAALALIDSNDFIILASGTSIHYLAREIANAKFERLTVLTPALKVSAELTKNMFVNTVQLGGEVRKSSTSVIGTLAEDVLKQFSCNKLFLGVDGIDLVQGFTTSNAQEAYLNRLMIERADERVILSDSSKMGKKGFAKICDLKDIDTLVTDSGISEKDLLMLQKEGINVIIAD